METITIAPPPFDAIAAYGIGLIAILMAIACVIVYSKGNSRRAMMWSIGCAIWMGVTAIAAKSGVLARFDFRPPPMMLMIVCVLALSFAIAFSSVGRWLAINISLIALVGLQVFRLPLELVMHHAASRSIMPPQLSYSGYNFDILTGIGAILLFLVFILRGRVPNALVWVWNIWGMICLVVILIIAVATSPNVRAFGNDPANLNTWALFFPYVWLPTVLVTIAISGHLMITRKLLRKAG